MESTRQLKYARLLQKELSEIFQREAGSKFDRAMITVTRVRVSPDLSVARVYVSLFAVKDRDALLKKIKEHGKELRHALAEKIRQQARVVPNLEFFIDDSLDYAERIDELLKK
jgi:ribosome-binding factor A